MCQQVFLMDKHLLLNSIAEGSESLREFALSKLNTSKWTKSPLDSRDHRPIDIEVMIWCIFTHLFFDLATFFRDVDNDARGRLDGDMVVSSKVGLQWIHDYLWNVSTTNFLAHIISKTGNRLLIRRHPTSHRSFDKGFNALILSSIPRNCYSYMLGQEIYLI